jgi:hypothetical protein
MPPLRTPGSANCLLIRGLVYQTPPNTLHPHPQDLGSNKHASTVFLNHAPGGIADVAAQIRTSFLEAQAGILPK